MPRRQPPPHENRQRMSYGISEDGRSEPPPPKLSKADLEQGASYLRAAALSPAAQRIALHQRQRALRERHAHLDRADPRIARALDLAAKHRREHDRDTRRANR